MKKTIFCAIMAVGSLAQVHAATTITATNYTAGGVYAMQILATNSPASAPYIGTVMIGTFTNTTGLGSAVGPINLANYGWTMFAQTPFNVSANQPGLFGATGATGTLPDVAGGAFIGNNVYAVIANAANNDYVIWNSGKLFAVEVPPLGGAPITFSTAAPSTILVRGAIVADGTKGLLASMASANGQDAVTFGALVPEPSAALLGCLGALGLLRRRR